MADRMSLRVPGLVGAGDVAPVKQLRGLAFSKGPRFDSQHPHGSS